MRLSPIQFNTKLSLPGLVLMILTLPLLHAADAPATPDPKAGRTFKIEVTPEGLPNAYTFEGAKLFAHADFLASDVCEGRLAGSPGEAKAREYIVARLKEAGFDEVRHFPFEFIADVGLGKTNKLYAQFLPAAKEAKSEHPWFREPKDVKTALGADKPPVDAPEPFASATDPAFSQYLCNEDYRPLRISTSGQLSAPLVFAGYGISAPDKGYDDYKDLDVKGKVVLVLRTEPETAERKRIGVEKADIHAGPSVYSDFYYKASTARDKGAVALILVNGKRNVTDAERAVLETFQRTGGKSDCGIPMMQVFPEIADDWLRPLGKDTAGLQKAIDEKLIPQSAAVPGVCIGMNVDVQREKATDENLAVVLPGTDPVLRDEILVIGAHYDHLGRGNEYSLADKSEMGKFHRGADDNASGVSAVLEIAAALQKNKAALKRTVWIMFFGAEELGTLGSNQFVKTPPKEFPLEKVSTMLNLDMVGRCREKKVMVYGVGTGVGFDAILKQANSNIGLEIKPSTDGFGGSDQTAFVNAGIPVMFFFTGSHPDYHKPSDTADKLNVGDQALICGLAFKTAAALINAPERPKFVKVETPKMSGGFGGTGLGTLPDYAYEGKGLRLSGVRDKSPADRAGMKAGDIILKLGEYKIENIYDYMNALKQSLAGVETTATIKRDDKEMNVKVTPEKR